MSGVNKVILVGRLGRDPEMRYTQGGMPIVNLNIATDRKWRNRQTNELVEETEWHRVSVFGNQAEHCNNYLAKGRQVYVEGRLRTRSYHDKDDIKRYATEVVASQVQFLGGKTGGSERGAPRGGAGSRSNGGSYPSGDDYDPGEYSPSSGDDGIPF